MHLFWQKGQKIQSTECFKTSSILNARFCKRYFKLKVNRRAVTSQTDKQPNMEVGSVWVCTGQLTWTNFQFKSPGKKLLFSSWAFVYFPLVISSFLSLVRCMAFRFFGYVYSSFHNRLDLITEPAIYWVLFSQFSLVCFIICNDEKGLFILVH